MKTVENTIRDAVMNVKSSPTPISDASAEALGLTEDACVDLGESRATLAGNPAFIVTVSVVDGPRFIRTDMLQAAPNAKAAGILVHEALRKQFPGTEIKIRGTSVAVLSNSGRV